MLHTNEISKIMKIPSFFLGLDTRCNTEANIGTILRARKLERLMKGTSTPPNKLLSLKIKVEITFYCSKS